MTQGGAGQAKGEGPEATLSTLARRLLPRPQALTDWFREAARALPWRLPPGQRREAYRVWVSEIMLQQTQAATVVPYYLRFLEAFPTLRALAEASEDELMKHWEGLGYYRRARLLQRAARERLAAGYEALPTTRDALLALPGIGPYTAGAIASLVYDEAVAAVDGNVLRVLSRLLNRDWQQGSPAHQREAARVVEAWYGRHPGVSPGLVNEALIELGALTCLPRQPRCADCPVAADCAALAAGRAAELPLRREALPRPVEHYAPLFVTQRERLLLLPRETGGLLGGLWQVPFVDGALDEGRRAALDEALAPFGAGDWRPLGIRRHIFSHLEWQLEAWALELDDASEVGVEALLAALEPWLASQPLRREEAQWLGRDDWARLAFPVALHGFLRALEGGALLPPEA